MFLILGSPRSGTTLLAQCLNANPQISIPHETDFIVPAAFLYQRLDSSELRKNLVAKLISGSRGFSTSLAEFFTHQDLLEIVDRHGATLLDLLCAIYDEIARRSGARTAGDKSPNDLAFLRMIERVGALLSERVKVVHIVRDVRDVVESISRTNWMTNPSERFPRVWSMANMQANVLCRNRAEYLLLRYEDFVADAESLLRSVCKHLDCDFDPRMLAPENRHPRYRKVRAHAMLYEPIQSSGIGRFRENLTPQQVESIERQAAEAMTAFGYSLTSSFGRKYAEIAEDELGSALRRPGH